MLRLKVQEQLFKELKKLFENMNRCLEPLGSRYSLPNLVQQDICFPFSCQVYKFFTVFYFIYQDMEDLMKEVQEARRIKMLHQPSKVLLDESGF